MIKKALLVVYEKTDRHVETNIEMFWRKRCAVTFGNRFSGSRVIQHLLSASLEDVTKVQKSIETKPKFVEEDADDGTKLSEKLPSSVLWVIPMRSHLA